MERKTGRTGFWEPGFSLFRNELQKEESQRLAGLKTQMKETADPDKKKQIRIQMAEIRADFQRKRKGAIDSLFIKK